ncbi:helix-turn-helix domain-containing protein [Desulfohalovibrio reitneri]|uniref:helix-turn-helix transcriptional regulator n=1 Tax=Desulfohalovibrio reitneri TaxID=1307759 RepID=UPI0004A746A6|nr:helix-turn-helix transcriptional regulator [Desulfohalovibrio reitneri]
MVAANRSARRLFRGKAPSLRGLNLRDLLAEGADEAAGRLHRLQPGERTALDLEGLGPDGSFSARAAASRLDLERSDSFHLLVRDRSERLRLEDELAEQRGRAEDMEVTLRNVLSATGEAERDFRRDLAGRVEREVLPVIRRIVDEPDRSRRAGYRRALTDSLLGLAQGGSTSLDARLLCLTPAEIDVCRLVQGGASSREAARELGVTFDTIQTHRRSIRRKLGLRGTPTSLCAFLKTIPPIP